MNCDDIFFPATEGNIQVLRERLDAGEVDLNESIDCGVCNGKHTVITLIFSIINKMIENGSINYEVLELLYQYGIDFDSQNILKDEASTMHIPLLVYCLAQWHNTELLKFLLEHGAYTNAVRTTYYTSGARERLNLLYFAIKYCKGTQELELLLMHGASPDENNLTYDEMNAAQQRLPALFYSAVIERNRDKSFLLLKYGASTVTPIDTGIGLFHKFALNDYLNQFYPAAYHMLYVSFDYSAYGTLKPIRKSSLEHPKQKLKINEQVQDANSDTPPSSDTSNNSRTASVQSESIVLSNQHDHQKETTK